MPTIHVPTYGDYQASRLDMIMKDKMPPSKTISKCLVEIAPGVRLRGFAWGDDVFVDGEQNEFFRPWAPNTKLDDTNTEPFFKAEVLGQAYTKTVQVKTRPSTYYYGHADKISGGLDAYDQNNRNRGWDYGYRENGKTYVPYAYLRIRITVEGADPVEAEFKFFQPTTGLATLNPSPNHQTVSITSEFFGMSRTWQELLITNQSRNQDTGLAVLYHHLKGSVIPDGADAWWERFFFLHSFPFGEDTAGLSSTLKRKDTAALVLRLQKDNPLDWKFFQWLQSSATVNKNKNNSLLAAFLIKIGTDYDALVRELRKARNEVAPATCSYYSYYTFSDKGGAWQESRRAICLTLPGAVDKVEEQEAKADWRKRKTNAGQADGLGIGAEFPLLRAAVESGEIPTSVFHQPSGEAVNIEFDLWEKSLGQKGWAEVIYNIAQTASKRGTYEKDISPYLAFLFRIPRYLEKHTGKKWSAMPTFIESEWKLEMDEENETGTTKRRSAFTPEADNKTCVITVPYVAVCVSGVRTQWCYSRFYHLFEEGFTDPISGGIVTKDFEPKLNGRDDYGLMFYTLTGTDTARGYPTFLIIFERLQRWEPTGRKKDTCLVEETRVHFHRVRPQRLKDGKHTPACKLVEACYQYMAGNIPATDITAQQGDLIFIKHPNDPIAAGAKTEPAREGLFLEFESHRFEPVAPGALMRLFESTAKTPSNRLGFLWAPGGLRVSHPEHMNIEGLGEGWYEVRRCKSWEANPKAIWSLTID